MSLLGLYVGIGIIIQGLLLLSPTRWNIFEKNYQKQIELRPALTFIPKFLLFIAWLLVGIVIWPVDLIIAIKKITTK